MCGEILRDEVVRPAPDDRLSPVCTEVQTYAVKRLQRFSSCPTMMS